VEYTVDKAIPLLDARGSTATSRGSRSCNCEGAGIGIITTTTTTAAAATTTIISHARQNVMKSLYSKSSMRGKRGCTTRSIRRGKRPHCYRPGDDAPNEGHDTADTPLGRIGAAAAALEAPNTVA
jgi:hypothetical protein